VQKSQNGSLADFSASEIYERGTFNERLVLFGATFLELERAIDFENKNFAWLYRNCR